MSTTLMFEAFEQHSNIRNSPSPGALRVEFQVVATDGLGDASIYMKLDRILFAQAGGGPGTTALTTAGVCDIATFNAGNSDSSLDENTLAFKGTASSTYHVILWGYYEGE